MKHCPNCGHQINPGDTFCQHCGYNLTNFKKEMNTNSRPQTNNQQPGGNQFRGPRSQPMRNNYPPNPNYYRPRHNGLSGLIIGAVVIIALGFGGTYAYHNNMPPFSWLSSSNSANRSSSTTNSTSTDSTSDASSNSNETTSTPSKSDAYDAVTGLWNNISNALDSDESSGGSTDFAQYFSGGTGNNSYQGIHDWKNEVKGADDNNDTEVVSITPYDLQMSRQGQKSVVSYKVKYDFKLHADSDHSHHHIQVFDWTTTFDNSSKIAKTNSPKTPEKDYDE